MATIVVSFFLSPAIKEACWRKKSIQKQKQFRRYLKFIADESLQQKAEQ